MQRVEEGRREGDAASPSTTEMRGLSQQFDRLRANLAREAADLLRVRTKRRPVGACAPEVHPMHPLVRRLSERAIAPRAAHVGRCSERAASEVVREGRS